MKKNLMKKALCAVSALTMMGSLAINASAATQHAFLVGYNDMTDYGIFDDESLTNAEKADLLKDYIVADSNDSVLITAMCVSYMYVVEGSITEEEMQDAVAIVANGGKMTGDLYEQVMSDDFFFSMYDFAFVDAINDFDKCYQYLSDWLTAWDELNAQFGVVNNGVCFRCFSDDPELADRNINNTGISERFCLPRSKHWRAAPATSTQTVSWI